MGSMPSPRPCPCPGHVQRLALTRTRVLGSRRRSRRIPWETGWQAGCIDPGSWGCWQAPLPLVRRERGVLQTATTAAQQSGTSGQPSRQLPAAAIWGDAPDRPRSGLRLTDAKCLDGEAGGVQDAAPPAGSREKCAPDASTNAAWMHPAPPRPPPKRARLQSGSAAGRRCPVRQLTSGRYATRHCLCATAACPAQTA